MRDLFVLAVVLVGSVVALSQPWIGVMVWTWVSIMNPHSLGWGFIRAFPVAAIVAVATMVGLLLTRNRRNPLSAPVIALMAFMIWMCITYPFSIYVDSSTEMLSRVLKIDLMIIVAVALIYTKKHIIWLAWIVALSLGFYGIKGGVFTLQTGGSYLVWGPGGFIEGNNEIALALVITIPLLRFLQLQASRVWVRHALLAVMVLSAIAALGSHSRGALLGLSAMAVYLWFKSPGKLTLGLLLAGFVIAVITFMPPEWFNRMHTIADYEQNASAMGRINAWWMTLNLARDRLLGGGFDIYNAQLFARYAPNPLDIHAAHSIYFQVLGEHGFVGLIIFLLMWFLVWRSAAWIIRNSGDTRDTIWCVQLAKMCQVSLVGYAVGGAFLSLAYFDLPYNVLVLVVTTQRWLLDQRQRQEATALKQMRTAEATA